MFPGKLFPQKFGALGVTIITVHEEQLGENIAHDIVQLLLWLMYLFMGLISDPFMVGLSRPGVRAGRLARVLVAKKVVESEVVVIVVVVVVGGGREAPIGPEPVEPVRHGLSGRRDRAEHFGEPDTCSDLVGLSVRIGGLFNRGDHIESEIEEGSQIGLSAILRWLAGLGSFSSSRVLAQLGFSHVAESETL